MLCCNEGSFKKAKNETIIRQLFNDKGMGVGYEVIGELVRCKECKHWKQTDEIPEHYGECLDSIFGYVAPREDFFCSNGERRSE